MKIVFLLSVLSFSASVFAKDSGPSFSSSSCETRTDLQSFQKDHPGKDPTYCITACLREDGKELKCFVDYDKNSEASNSARQIRSALSKASGSELEKMKKKIIEGKSLKELAPQFTASGCEEAKRTFEAAQKRYESDMRVFRCSNGSGQETDRSNTNINP